jgi:uncharacterized NAD(P)/FAD-binding protein YdhS
MVSNYDLVFVGAGLSCSYTLKHFITLLRQKFQDRTPKLLFLEKDREFWTGIPYGNRSGYQAHIITSLRHFIPADERDEFTEWLKNNINWVFDDFKLHNENTAAEWLGRHENAIRKHEWDGVYIPRYIFGQFLKDKINNLLDAAVKEGLIEYDMVKASVTSIRKNGPCYEIDARTDASPVKFVADKVVLSIGSPPIRPCFQSLNSNDEEDVLAIEDMYDPSLSGNIEAISTFVNERQLASCPQNILIVGSNASALEVLYALINKPDLKESNFKIHVLSASGSFPHAINEEGHLSTYRPLNLERLKNKQSITPAAIYDAIRDDIGNALEKGMKADDTYYPISSILIDLVKSLDGDEKKQFVSHYGFEIGKLQRRAGADYLNIVNNLMEQGRLQMIKGRLKDCVHTDEGIKLRFADDDDALHTYWAPFSVLINCTGSDNLKNAKSPLISNLINTDTCTINTSGKGLVVNHRFEANENLFIMGPLLAGNIIGDKIIWHVESCNRIFSLAQCLAPYLAD